MRLSNKLLIFIFEIIAIITLVELNLYFSETSNLNKPQKRVEVLSHYPSISFGNLLAIAPKPQVLAAAVEVKPTPLPSNKTSQKSYIIAAIGDSMVETMGDSLEYLSKVLRKKYPATNFVFYNYGVGGENVDAGLGRFDKEFSHLTKNYPSLPDLRPDILIVGSFAYNPFFPYSRDRHWIELSALIDKAKGVSGKVYLLAEIAPLEHGFGVGPGGVNWPSDLADTQAEHITELLENAETLARDTGVGLIDVYSESKVSGSRFGKPEYVNPNDGIHPSVLGHKFTANLIASTVDLSN